MNMKRLFAFAFALALTLSLAAVSLAVTSGGLYLPDEDSRYVTDQVSEMSPGKTYYLAIEEAPSSSSSSKPASKASARELEITRNDENGKKVSLIPSSLNIVRRRTGTSSSDWWWFVEVKPKAVGISEYPEDGYFVDGYITAGSYELTLPGTIAYPEGSGVIERDPQYFIYDDSDEEELYLPDDDSTVTIDSKGVKSKLLLAMNTDYNDSIASKYPNANIDFFNGNGASFKKTATMRIVGNSGDYLYEYKDGQLSDLTRYWDKSEDAFIFKTRTLGSYLRSDRKLTGATDAPISSSSSSSSSSGGNSSSGLSGDALSNLISNYFSNKFTIIAYGDKYENIGSTVTLKCQLDLSALNTKTLVVYAYNEATNQLIALPNAGAYVDTTGSMIFKTPVKGRYVITDSALKAK